MWVSFLGSLWASSGNELAAAATMLQAVGLCGRGEGSVPSVDLHCTHIWALQNWEERARNVEQNLQTHIGWQPLTQASLPRATLRPGCRACQTGGETVHRQCGVHQSLCFPGSLTAYFPRYWVGEKKRMQFITAPRPSILSLEDVGCTYIHLKLFLTRSLLNLFMKGVQERENELNF